MMIIDNPLTQYIASTWALLVALAKGQPLGAIVVCMLLADGVLTVLGKLVDFWDYRGAKEAPPPASRNELTPPACGPAAGR